MNWTHAGRSDVGRVRPGNEDSFFADPENGVFLVADGMGGHAAGEIASRMAAEMIGPDVARAVAQGIGGRDLGDRIVQLIEEANQAIRGRAHSEPDKSGMGTTVTLLVLSSRGRYRVGQVGDSRGYVFRDGRIGQVTRDHTLVQQQVEEGRLTTEQARSHPLSHILTRALGTEVRVHVDIYEGEARAGDVFLLCSDGLTGMLSDEDIAEILRSNGQDIEAAAEALIGAANAAGGQDNITALLVRVGE